MSCTEAEADTDRAADVYAGFVRKLISWLTLRTAAGELFDIDTALPEVVVGYAAYGTLAPDGAKVDLSDTDLTAATAASPASSTARRNEPMASIAWCWAGRCAGPSSPC